MFRTQLHISDFFFAKKKIRQIKLFIEHSVEKYCKTRSRWKISVKSYICKFCIKNVDLMKKMLNLP